MEEKKSCMKLNINSKTYLYALFLPISCMFIHFFQEIMIRKSKDTNHYKILKYNLPLLFYYFLPKIFSLFIILIIRSKSKGESNIEEQNKLIRRYHISIKKENRKLLFLIYIISLLEVIYKANDSVLYYLKKIEKTKTLIEKRTGFIIFVPLFSYLILHKKLYKHHVFALILTIIGAIIIHITRFSLGYSTFKDIGYHILNLGFSSIFSLSLVLIKYVMVKYLIISPYNFLFYDGIFCVTNSFLCPFLEYPFVTKIDDVDKNPKIKGENDHYFKNNFSEIIKIFKVNNFVFYLSFILSFLASFGYFICNASTIFYFSPYLNVLTDFVTPFLLYLFSFIFLNEDDNKGKNIRIGFEIFGFIIVFFGALILNEIIIFNCFGLNENTYLSISERGEKDSGQELSPNLLADDNDDDDNNEGEGNTIED